MCSTISDDRVQQSVFYAWRQRGRGDVKGGVWTSKHPPGYATGRGGYIIRFSYFVFCITGNQCMSLIYTLKVSYHVKVCDLWLFHQCAFVMGYHTAPTHYWSVLLQSYPFEKRLSLFPSVTPVWVGGQMGYGPDLSCQQDCYFAISMSASLTTAAPLYCSSRPLALLCIWAKITFFLCKVSLVKFWTSRIRIIVSSPQVWRWQPFVEITNNIMKTQCLRPY